MRKRYLIILASLILTGSGCDRIIAKECVHITDKLDSIKYCRSLDGCTLGPSDILDAVTLKKRYDARCIRD